MLIIRILFPKDIRKGQIMINFYWKFFRTGRKPWEVATKNVYFIFQFFKNICLFWMFTLLQKFKVLSQWKFKIGKSTNIVVRRNSSLLQFLHSEDGWILTCLCTHIILYSLNLWNLMLLYLKNNITTKRLTITRYVPIFP